MADRVSVNHYILLFKYLSTHMHSITNGYKRFLRANSTDPRQRVPLMVFFAFKGCEKQLPLK